MIFSDSKYNTRYAFVEFADSVMANSACLLDGLQVGGRSIRVAMSKPSAPVESCRAVSSDCVGVDCHDA